MSTTFVVTVETDGEGWIVDIGGQGGTQYAKTIAPTLDTALRMAVPYMACAAEPDPFADALRSLR